MLPVAERWSELVPLLQVFLPRLAIYIGLVWAAVRPLNKLPCSKISKPF